VTGKAQEERAPTRRYLQPGIWAVVGSMPAKVQGMQIWWFYRVYMLRAGVDSWGCPCLSALPATDAIIRPGR
jgi:hypothetical protein